MLKGKERVLVLDQDGVVIENELKVQLGATKRFVTQVILCKPRLPRIPDALPVINRQTIDRPFHSQREAAAFAFHKRRTVKEDTRDLLNDYAGHIYGNTGRKDTTAWTSMTWKTLENGGIESPRYETMYFAPDNLRGLVSKAEAFSRIKLKHPDKTLREIDDNPFDLIPQAQMYPNDEFVLLRDRSSWYLLLGLKVPPNVRVASCLEEAIYMEFS